MSWQRSNKVIIKIGLQNCNNSSNFIAVAQIIESRSLGHDLLMQWTRTIYIPFEEDHERIIPTKFGQNLTSSLGGVSSKIIP